MTDPQRRAVEAIARSYYVLMNGETWVNDHDPDMTRAADDHNEEASDIIASLRSANLVILDRETVESAIAVAKAFTPRWTEYECFTQMQEALGDV